MRGRRIGFGGDLERIKGRGWRAGGGGRGGWERRTTPGKVHASLVRERKTTTGKRWVKGYGPAARWAGLLLALVAGLLRGEREKGQGRNVAWIRGLGFCFKKLFLLSFQNCFVNWF
jgi:hypothetical protein